MSSKLSSLVNDFSKIYSKECRGYKEGKNIELVCDFIALKNNKLHYKCNSCIKRWLKHLGALIKKFFSNAYKFCTVDINKFVLLLKKVVYAYEYPYIWERFNETTLSNKKAFYLSTVNYI